MTTQTTDRWCSTCGAWRGTTQHPQTGPHRPLLARAGRCHDTDTFTDPIRHLGPEPTE